MDATAWSLIGLVLFLGLIAYMKVPAMITGALDKRADGIRQELDDARKLREEAQSLLADYQRKRQEAEVEAEGIIAEAKLEAERLTVEANEALEEMIARRTAAAERKIEQAEGQAVAEVRARAAEIAVTAATDILGKKVAGKVSDELLTKSIGEVKDRLN
ncbi:ATP F0F1 synthase subunit B [Stappia taiwanensis]|uniref:ATP synthase subunit b n=1 Tax=Stappia taiwanensis TaxID=992267 RepID=A0A838XN83_9HYPH|nr:ATP F0F1 synthase subunit B [Stappia taiwanensis]MBA4611975.1 ATP F0F1 synthase subunit B [Stappia taiwanensis]GGE92107.1 ATP synthase subunit b 1 [Stappia taiwanensis]